MTHGLPRHVRIVEVGPRDGLQNEAAPLPPAARVELIDDLSSAGLSYIECGSFVSPKRVPQMAGSDSVFQSIRRMPGVTYSALVPNLRGLEQALACGVNEMAVFVAASEEFSHANIECSIDESLVRAQQVISGARAHGVPVRGYVSCALGCPFSGEVPVARVVEVAEALHLLGCREISLGDTIGVGTPLRARALVEAAARHIPLERIAVHFHDTWGQALANIFAVVEAGVGVVDSSVAGLGGCPYAPGATGNVATEDLVYMLQGMGIPTGVDLAALGRAAERVLTVLGSAPASKAARAMRAASRRSGG